MYYVSYIAAQLLSNSVEAIKERCLFSTLVFCSGQNKDLKNHRGVTAMSCDILSAVIMESVERSGGKMC